MKLTVDPISSSKSPILIIKNSNVAHLDVIRYFQTIWTILAGRLQTTKMTTTTIMMSVTWLLSFLSVFLWSDGVDFTVIFSSRMSTADANVVVVVFVQSECIAMRFCWNFLNSIQPRDDGTFNRSHEFCFKDMYNYNKTRLLRCNIKGCYCFFR